MKEFFQAGGFPMWFVLVFGLMSLAAAIRFAMRPAQRRVAVVKDLTLAALFSIAAGIVTDLATVCSHVPANPEWANSPKIHLVILVGIGESLTPGILGFTLLSLTWMVQAVGHRRLAALESAD